MANLEEAEALLNEWLVSSSQIRLTVSSESMTIVFLGIVVGYDGERLSVISTSLERGSFRLRINMATDFKIMDSPEKLIIRLPDKMEVSLVRVSSA